MPEHRVDFSITIDGKVAISLETEMVYSKDGSFSVGVDELYIGEVNHYLIGLAAHAFGLAIAEALARYPHATHKKRRDMQRSTRHVKKGTYSQNGH